MAVLNPDRTMNRWKIEYVSPKLGRKTCMGVGPWKGEKKVSRRNREKILSIVHELEESYLCNEPPTGKALKKVAALPEKFQKKIENSGLIPSYKLMVLGDLQKEWLESLRGKAKSTVRCYYDNTKHLIEFLGADRAVGTITSFQLQTYPEWLVDEVGLSGRTPYESISKCRTMMKFAKKRGYIAVNPLDDISALPADVAAKIMISDEHRERLLAAARSDEERLLVALWAYGGMRMREPSLLEWDECRTREVDGEEVPAEFLVHEYKIVRNGKMRKRVTPAFEKVFPHLLQHWKTRDPDSKWIISHPKWRFENRTAFDSLMTRLHKLAGLERPKRLFNNLRATASEEVVAAHGTARENEWLGHCEEVRRKHYRSELSTTAATSEALGFLDSFSLKNGADMERKDAAGGSNGNRSVETEGEFGTSMRAVATHGEELQKVARKSCRSAETAKTPGKMAVSEKTGADTGATATKTALETAFSADAAKELLLKLLTKQPELLKKLLE